MPKLHEGLALAADRGGIAKKITDEARATFKNGAHFLGWVKSTAYIDEKDKFQDRTEEKNLDETVPSKLTYVAEKNAGIIDLVYQMDIAARTAVADLVVDGKIFAKEVPVNFLVGLESRLKELRAMYEMIPTHQPGVNWVADTDKSSKGDIYKSSTPIYEFITKKVAIHTIVVPATEHHPAQVAQSHEDVRIAKSETIKYTGTISPAEKSDMLGRIDKLIQASKRARSRANQVPLGKEKIANTLFNFINSGNMPKAVDADEDAAQAV